MSNAYSYDFRKKVIDAIELDGLKKCEAAQVFNISRNTINLWFQLKAATGDVRAQSYRPPGHSHCITDWDKFRAFANQHGDKTQAQMAQLWEGDISARSISRALRRIGFTRKKRHMATGSGTSSSVKSSSRSLRV